MWAGRYNLFELLQKFLIVCYKDQFACYFEPALLQRRMTVSVSWHSALDCTLTSQDVASLFVRPAVAHELSVGLIQLTNSLVGTLRQFCTVCVHFLPMFFDCVLYYVCNMPSCWNFEPLNLYFLLCYGEPPVLAVLVNVRGLHLAYWLKHWTVDRKV